MSGKSKTVHVIVYKESRKGLYFNMYLFGYGVKLEQNWYNLLSCKEYKRQYK